MIKSIYSFTKRKIVDSYLWNNDSYTKFVVLTSPRSGSNFLMSQICSHKQAHIFGELFNPTNVLAAYYGWPFPLYKKENKSFFMNYRNDKPIEFLDKYIYRKYDKRIKVVGFKLFYDHRSNEEVWDYLLSNNIKIIHLIRTNFLDSYVSLLIAQKNSIWKSTKKINKNIIVNVDVEKMLRYFRSIEDNIMENTRFFKNSDILEVSYDDLFTEKTIKDVLDFLNLEFQNLQSDYIKQNSPEISEKIENFEEVKEALSNTQYEIFLHSK